MADSALLRIGCREVAPRSPRYRRWRYPQCMDKLGPLKSLLSLVVPAPVRHAIEAADTVSGGHIMAAASTSDELFGEAIESDTRDAAIQAFDAARLNGSRAWPMFEILQDLVSRVERLEEAWKDRPAGERPEVRDLIAGAALVAPSHSRQMSRSRRELILDALAGSFCPEPYLWGFQDELLRDLSKASITDADLKLLEKGNTNDPPKIQISQLHSSAIIDGLERLALGNFILLEVTGGGRTLIRTRHDKWHGRATTISGKTTHRGRKLLLMIEAGRRLRA